MKKYRGDDDAQWCINFRRFRNLRKTQLNHTQPTMDKCKKPANWTQESEESEERIEWMNVETSKRVLKEEG